MTLKHLKLNLHETAIWCSTRLDLDQLEKCFRSEELRPEGLNSTDGDWLRSEMIHHVITKRKNLIEGLNLNIENSASGEGRILVSAYEYTNHNGLVQGELKGYFDLYDNPPWDTWIGEVDCSEFSESITDEKSVWPENVIEILERQTNKKILLAWVPSPFVKLVNSAIEMECVGMLGWLDDLPDGEKDSLAPDFKKVIPSWVYKLIDHS